MELLREVVIFAFAIYMTLWAGSRAFLQIQGNRSFWKVTLWTLFLLFNLWTWLSILSGWMDESLVNTTVPFSLFPFYDGVLQGLIDFISAQWDWLITR